MASLPNCISPTKSHHNSTHPRQRRTVHESKLLILSCKCIYTKSKHGINFSWLSHWLTIYNRSLWKSTSLFGNQPVSMETNLSPWKPTCLHGNQPITMVTKFSPLQITFYLIEWWDDSPSYWKKNSYIRNAVDRATFPDLSCQAKVTKFYLCKKNTQSQCSRT